MVLALGMTVWPASEGWRPGLPAPAPAQRSDVGERIATSVGQRAEARLGDGSRVVLNTASELRVRFDDTHRRVELVRGQAWFEVARDAGRPFVVAAAGREITALGTAFDVRIDRGRLEVLLVEGRVRVDRPQPARTASPASSLTLSPNEMLVAGSGEAAVRKVPDPAPVASWRSGLLVFDDRPLAEAVAEFNRYASRPMRVADRETGAIRISGAFRIGDDRAFLGALDAGFGVRAATTDTAIILSRE